MQQQQFINNSNQLGVFRTLIPPIFGSTRLCYSLWYNAPNLLLAVSLETLLPG